MGIAAIIRHRESDGEDYRDYKKALKVAKKALKMAEEAMETICDLTEDMEEEFGGESGIYDEREEGMTSGHGVPVLSEREWEEVRARRRRRSHMRRNM